MSAAGSDRQREDNEREPLFTGGALLQPEPRPWKPFAIAGAVLLMILAGLLLAGQRRHEPPNPGGAGLAAPADYAASLPISGLEMSDSSNLSGGKEMYLDGTVRNTGKRVVRAITVQIGFKDVVGTLAAKETLPLNLIRFREPYVDTEPVSAEPIQPGESRSFRLIFDATPQSWDGAYPEVRVIAVGAQ